MMRSPNAAERGQALVEVAFVLPILLLGMLGLVDLGRAVYAYSAIGDAARQGTRTAIVDQYEANIRTRAAQQATGVGIDASRASTSANCPTSGSSPALMTPSGASGVCVQYLDSTGSHACPTTSGFDCIAVVTVKATITPITPMIGLLTGPIELVQRAQQPVESVCSTASCPIP